MSNSQMPIPAVFTANSNRRRVASISAVRSCYTLFQFFGMEADFLVQARVFKGIGSLVGQCGDQLFICFAECIGLFAFNADHSEDVVTRFQWDV